MIDVFSYQCTFNIFQSIKTFNARTYLTKKTVSALFFGNFSAFFFFLFQLLFIELPKEYLNILYWLLMCFYKNDIHNGYYMDIHHSNNKHHSFGTYQYDCFTLQKDTYCQNNWIHVEEIDTTKTNNYQPFAFKIWY